MDVLVSEAEHAKQLQSKPRLIVQGQLRAAWLDLLMKAVVNAQLLTTKNPSSDLFAAFAMLGTRFASHQQAVFLLTTMGRYGEAAAVCRMLMEATDLFTYFTLFPSEVGDWRSSTRNAPDADGPQERRARRKFSSGQVRERLKASDQDRAVSDETYRELNSVIHTSEWGTQHYGHRIPGQGTVLTRYFPDGIQCFHKHTILRQSRL